MDKVMEHVKAAISLKNEVIQNAKSLVSFLSASEQLGYFGEFARSSLFSMVDSLVTMGWMVQLVVIASLGIAAFCLLAAILRVSRFIFAVILFLVQFFLVFAFVVLVIHYRENLSLVLHHLASKVDL